jgi:hypothetical protein
VLQRAFRCSGIAALAIGGVPNTLPPAAPQATPAAQPPAAATTAGNRTLCISGKLQSCKKKADYEAPLRAVGIELVDEVSRGLCFLVLADPMVTSSKADKARKLGASVISKDKLMTLCSQTPDSTESEFKQCVLRYLAEHPELADKEKYELITPSELIEKHIHFMEESFLPVTESRSISAADRRASMFGGPLFTSDKYPQLYNSEGKPMLPVLQIDLGWLGNSSKKYLGAGLLQLWFNEGENDGKYYYQEGHIRLIPPHDVNFEELVPFMWNVFKEVDELSSIIPWGLAVSDDDKYLQIVGLEGVGFTCPEISNGLDFISEFDQDEHEQLMDYIYVIENNSTKPTHFFGQFRPLQSAVEDFYPRRLLLNIGDWGGGYAHIFYESNSGDSFPEFSFSHCSR